MIKKIAIYSVCIAVMFVQEQLLSFIANVQFTTLLIVIYFMLFGFKPTIVICIIHTLLDNLFMGTLNLIYTPAMLVGWCILPIILQLFFRKTVNEWVLATVGGLHAILYSICFIVAQAFIGDVDIIAYLIADIPFTLILIVVNFLTIAWLYKPLYQTLNSYLSKVPQ